MFKDVKKCINSCDSCQRNKSNNQQTAGLLQTLPTPTTRWQQITMDFIVQLPKTPRGYDAITVFVDRLSKRAHFIPCTTDITAPGVAKLFFENIFRLHGLPKTIISDRDPKFTSKFWTALFKLLETKLAMSTAFHPQTDGQTERMNRTLEEMLRAYTTYHQNQWDECLSATEFAYNNSKQTSTGQTPFELDNGQHPLLPTDLDQITNVPAANDVYSQWKANLQYAQD